MTRKNRDQGIVSAFVVGIALTLILSTGLALDSGRLVAARVEIADHAENAARLAAQEVVGIRSGRPMIDPARGRRVASNYLANHGLDGTVTIGSRSVTVEVHTTRNMLILQLAGISSKTVSASRTAEITDA